MVEAMEKGYKQSEVGVIPEDWEVKNINDLSLKVGSGITPTGGERVYKKEGRPFIRSQNVGLGNLILDDIAFIDEVTHNSFNSTEIQENDIFLNITGASIGRSAIADKRVVKGNVNQHVCIIRVDENRIEPKFINYFLLSNLGQKQIINFQAGGNRQGLNFGQIKSIQTPLPPTKAEQTAIATALTDADSLISSLEKIIAKKRAIKQGAMQGMLSESGFTGLKDEQDKNKTDKGHSSSGKWEVKKLGEVFKFLNTANNSRAELKEEGAIEYIHYGDIHTRWHNFLDCSKNELPFIDEEKIKGIPLLQDGDLIIADASEDYEGLAACIEIKNIGKRKIVAGLHTLLLRGNKEIIADGIKGYLKHFHGVQNALIAASTGVSVYGISKTNLKEIEINLPTITEQTHTAQILSDMDAEIEALEKRLEKYKMIKQGMMQELLTGKIRLNQDLQD